jgi:hypothetical protein
VVDPYPATTEPAARVHDDTDSDPDTDPATKPEPPKHHDTRTKPNPYD